jgi:5-methylcytosine-specific restriction endonuclease McrA
MAHTKLLRTQVEVAAACGMNGREIGRRFGISKTTVYRWIKPGTHKLALQASRRWREENPARAKQAHKRWYYQNIERARGLGRSSMKKWRINNPDKARIRDEKNYRQQYDENPERFARKALLRQERMKSFPMTEIEKMMCANYYKEARRLTQETGTKHEVDHIWPLSRGGPHLPWNLRVITAKENRKKSDKI